MNPLLVNIIMISLIVRANTSHGLSLRFDYHLACASLAIIHHMALCASACTLLGLHKQSVLCASLSAKLPSEQTENVHFYQLGQQVSTLSKGGSEKSDKDIGEETLTQRAALPDQYTNTNADMVIDKPLLTTEGRKLSTIIG